MISAVKLDRDLAAENRKRQEFLLGVETTGDFFRKTQFTIT